MAALPAPIRRARPDEIDAVVAADRAAGELFRAVGMPEVADDPPPPRAEYERFSRSGDLWVVPAGPADADPPVALALLEAVDGALHVEQLSVDPRWSRRGLGRALLDHASDLARADGQPAVTLTTFVDVPFNAPYYRRLGFEDVPEDELGPGLGAILAAERARFTGPRHARVAMRRPV
jgi:ribosomal protein S18 acetylase RimI-like enzyme